MTKRLSKPANYS